MKSYRNGYKWSIPEILQLQREWELLELPIAEIAEMHSRTIQAIQYKLIEEGFTTQ